MLQISFRAKATAILSITATLLITQACSSDQPAQKNGNAPASANANRPVAAATPTPTPTPPKKPSGGNIDIKSDPAGATVMLIEDLDGQAGAPKLRGATPTTLTGVAPGKYTVHLEKTGFRFFQKDVDVKEGETVKVTATLRH